MFTAFPGAIDMFVEKEFKGLRKHVHEMWFSTLPK